MQINWPCPTSESPKTPKCESDEETISNFWLSKRFYKSAGFSEPSSSECPRVQNNNSSWSIKGADTENCWDVKRLRTLKASEDASLKTKNRAKKPKMIVLKAVRNYPETCYCASLPIQMSPKVPEHSTLSRILNIKRENCQAGSIMVNVDILRCEN